MRGRIARVARSLSRRLPNRVVRSVIDSPLGRFLPHTEPLLSVIVPVYNVEEYLGECLDSLLDQTLTSMEIIIVDDGSTDRLAEPSCRLSPPRSRFVVFGQSNAGPGAARNWASTARAPLHHLPGLRRHDSAGPRTGRWSPPSTEPDPTSPSVPCDGSGTGGGRCRPGHATCTPSNG